MTTEPTSSTPDYTMGFSDEMLDALRRYTVDSHAAYLKPYLRPGLRVLDVGCGLGTISVGLAKAVVPGEMHGIDMEATQIELAKSVAIASGVDNAIFQVADAAELPFDDNFFDVAHFHNVLMHIPDTQETLTEVKRVLKPGGIIGASEMICDSSFNYPDFNVLDQAWNMFEDLLAADDGHPQMGKQLKEHMTAAGLANILVKGSFEMYNTPADVEFIYQFANRWFLSDEIIEAAIKYGASTRELCNGIKAAYERWRAHPGAFCAIAYGEVLANKP